MANNSNLSDDMKSKKRKKKTIQEPPAAKRHKTSHTERFKFVLAPSRSGSESPELPEEAEEVQVKSDLSKIYESTTSDSDSWMDEDLESFSDEENDEECGEEWETDTDYSESSGSDDSDSECSFHQSDCEEVQSSNDSDYEPPYEDKYIKKGDGALFDAKGLDIAFGDTSDSQILDISDFNFDMNDDDEDPPLLVDENGCEVPQVAAIAEPKIIESTENEDMVIQFSELLKRVTFYDCIDDQGVVVCLNKTIHFLGVLEIRPLFNSIQINGYNMKTGERLKATSISHANFYLNLSPIINNENDTDRLINELTKLIPESVEEVMIKLNRDTDVLVHLKQGIPDMPVEFLKVLCSNAILPHKNMILKNSPSPSSEVILASKFFVGEENPRLNCFRVNEDWKYVEMKSDSRIVVVGGKNVGKSTLAQFLVNQNVPKFKKILLIDFDIGQPICGLPQTISASVVSGPIIGAGYLNSNVKTVKSFLFGDKSITNNPYKYVQCARHLIEFCNKEGFKNMPWVINTLGYHKGFGLQLLNILIRIIQPSDVVQIQHANPKYNYECIVNEHVINNASLNFFEDNHMHKITKHAYFTTHVLSSLVNNSQSNDESVWISNATEKRKMSLLAHLSKLLQSGQSYLNEVVPHRVEINRIRMVTIDEEYENEIETAAKLDLFNGNLIYLCADLPLENSILECFGVGLVRAIDKIHGYMYILMPQEFDEKMRSDVDVIAIGNIPLPSDILLKQNFTTVDGTVPYVTFFKNRGAKKYLNKRNIKDCY